MLHLLLSLALLLPSALCLQALQQPQQPTILPWGANSFRIQYSPPGLPVVNSSYSPFNQVCQAFMPLYFSSAGYGLWRALGLPARLQYLKQACLTAGAAGLLLERCGALQPQQPELLAHS